MQHYGHGLKTALQSCCRLLRSRKKLHYLLCGASLALVSVFFLVRSCGKKPTAFTPEERREADSIVRSVHSVDSLALLQKQLERSGKRLGSIVALREWGKALRNESRFEEALSVHSTGQQLAEAAGDTLELVQALNNVGTDYRRMGVLDVAQEYHYRAWKLSEECADTSFTARKNRVVSLNGLGNAYLTLGNYERADSALRMALAGERSLHSTVGQAINYANIGSIFEHYGKMDSARVYYLKSMALNTEAGNKLGISLCHTYFGSLYEKAGQYDKAMAEYETASQMMQASKDEWHALNSLIALAGIHHAMGNDAKAMAYLGKARQMAESIKSTEHLAEIYTLYYKTYKQSGDSRAALASYEKATAMQDSVLDMEKVNRIQNTSLRIERNRQDRQMDEARRRLEQERTTRYIGYAVLGLGLLGLAGVLAMVLYTNRLRRRNHQELKRMSALRENFFTNITHEFRTPLTVILGLSRELQNSGKAEVRDKAQTIERQGNGLLTLINQLLDISKIKSAVGNPDWKNGNIMTYLTMIVESYRSYARSRNIDLQFFPKGEVVMDFVPNYVMKVMNNLLSNAFKFTPEYGKVSVLAWCENQHRQGERLPPARHRGQLRHCRLHRLAVCRPLRHLLCRQRKGGTEESLGPCARPHHHRPDDARHGRLGSMPAGAGERNHQPYSHHRGNCEDNRSGAHRGHRGGSRRLSVETVQCGGTDNKGRAAVGRTEAVAGEVRKGIGGAQEGGRAPCRADQGKGSRPALPCQSNERGPCAA